MRAFPLFIISYAILFVSCSPKYGSFVSVPNVNGSPLSFEITNIWTGKSNLISTPFNLLKIWADNGTIERKDNDA